MRVRMVLGTAGLLLAAYPAAGGAQTYLVLIEGLGGEPRFEETFDRWVVTLADAARDAGVPEEHVLRLVPDRVPGAGATARSTGDEIRRVLGALAVRAEPSAQVLIVLVGHGSSAAGPARFNLPGPDMTAEDFAPLLDAFATQAVAFVSLASASGGWVSVLSAEGRVVVTATRSDREQLETIFGGHFTAAFAREGADTDHDGRVSLLEAFAYARAEVARDYERRNVMLTEHALLDDDGDGFGTLEPGVEGADGARAGRFFLEPGPATVAGGAPADSVLRGLLEEQRRLEAEIATLRGRRASMAEAEYDAELERLLLALARTSRAIREREGGER